MGKWIRASYTVEAAVLMPLVLWITAAGIGTGVHLYESVREEFLEKEKICQTDAVNTVRRLAGAEDIWEALNGDKL